nr:GAF domain-containing protein [Paenibacillus xylanexedens]
MHDEVSSAVQEMMSGLCQNTAGDFCGMACVSGSMLRWKYTFGATNERVKRMTMRPGQDLVGTALRTGRTVMLDEQSQGEFTPDRCPLMLAERLVCAIAVPLFREGLLPSGVLLVGSRTPCTFSPEMVMQTEQAARQMEQYV